jgi:hypothetical protein
MSNTRSGNVWIVDTAAQFDESVCITGVKVVNANGSAQTSTIKSGGSSGTTVYTTSVSANSEKYEELKIALKKGEAIYITPGTSCTIYLYLE